MIQLYKRFTKVSEPTEHSGKGSVVTAVVITLAWGMGRSVWRLLFALFAIVGLIAETSTGMVWGPSCRVNGRARRVEGLPLEAPLYTEA
jgi:hypothetical protein